MKASDICRQAADLVRGDRAETYGDMAVLHEKIAVLWDAWLSARRDPSAPLTGEDVAHMSALLKMARSQCGEGTDDNYIDAAAYEGIAGELNAGPDE